MIYTSMEPVYGREKCCGLCDDAKFNKPCGYRRVDPALIPDCCAVCAGVQRSGFIMELYHCTVGNPPEQKGALGSQVDALYVCDRFVRK